jgi:hypothetical protein
MTRLLDDVSPIMLRAVRGEGTFVHFVFRESLRDKEAPQALCLKEAPLTDRGVRRWRLVHGASAKVCGTCHAVSCSYPTRIDWS